MQNRLKDADEKNSILLKTLNETFGKLSAIPNGKLEKYCKAWLIPALFHNVLSLNICLIFVFVGIRCFFFLLVEIIIHPEAVFPLNMKSIFMKLM